jgi:hypothetical protein
LIEIGLLLFAVTVVINALARLLASRHPEFVADEPPAAALQDRRART